MLTLEEEIDSLGQLDQFRQEARRLRKGGMTALAQMPDGAWERADDQVERALLVRAIGLGRRRGDLEAGGSIEDRMAAYNCKLEETTIQSLADKKEDIVPVLGAARVMHAMVSTPGKAFNAATLYCYYRLIRELYSTSAPEWITGAARAGEGGASSAFVTSECARGVLALAQAIDNTAELFRFIGDLIDTFGDDTDVYIAPKWMKVERERSMLAFYVSATRLGSRILVDVTLPKKDATVETVDSFLSSLPTSLRDAFEQAQGALRSATEEIDAFRIAEEDAATRGNAGAKLRFDCDETPHRIAKRVLGNAGALLEFLQKLIPPPGEGGKPEEQWKTINWKSLDQLLSQAATSVRKTLRPAVKFVDSVVDRELASSGNGEAYVCDCAELACAASTYGAMTGRWSDPRLAKAAHILARQLSNDGTFPMGRPFHAMRTGYTLHVIGAEITRAVAQLFRHLNDPLDPQVVRRLLALFERTRVDLPERPDSIAWSHEQPRQPAKATLWVSALSAIALDGIVSMLDWQINSRIEKHFSVVKPVARGPLLHQLVYGDYGFHDPDGERKSVAIHLQRMRAHLVGGSILGSGKTLNSLILHGPAGTGKTTLIEALALTAEKPLYNVTPSDILVGGADEVERRARVVFRSLAMLTDAVILFDEFDPILRGRDKKAKVPTQVFEFLTPGMLPKLRSLHDASATQRVVYALATNLIGTLDEAAIRRGRFDEKVGIYSPDLVSRAGRLGFEISRASKPNRKLWGEWKGRYAQIVGRTANTDIGRFGPAIICPKEIRAEEEVQKIKKQTVYSVLSGRESKGIDALDWIRKIEETEDMLKGDIAEFKKLVEEPVSGKATKKKRDTAPSSAVREEAPAEDDSRPRNEWERREWKELLALAEMNRSALSAAENGLEALKDVIKQQADAH